ncbi:MCE family protein [Nocardioides humilatus]|uniref:MCE family protein n=1 Tax=Nocardioides humilatus TaxID=2607660 RepID=A0A5B1LQC2_9ACTN|nr:MlaD family protein [Nocardioides humilatus]KAA1421889.1 MCE family protein [Nocardioides humilatus]
MLSKVTRTKLFVFVGITAVTLLVMALAYVRLPQQMGIGRYDVSVELSNAGGLYPQAMVTYRGVEVGKVTDVVLQDDGSVVAELQVDNGTELPDNSTVEVRSASVIGEQYVNFVPPADPASDHLEDGATVPVERTVLPTTTNSLLTSVDQLLSSIPQKDLRSVVSELQLAFDGAGQDLGRFIDASAVFTKAATDNLPQTIRLIEDSAPVLATQAELDPSIRSYASSLGSFSGQLEKSDDDLRGLMAAGAPFMEAIGGFAVDLTGVAPGMLAELADLGEVLKVYRDGIEHILIVLPALTTAFTAAIPEADRHKERSPANLWFKLGFDPPTCTDGFEQAQQIRNPDDISAAEPPGDSWCKVSPDDIRASRGARNHPCPNGGTGANAALCGLHFDRTSALDSVDRSANGSNDATTPTGSLELGLTSFLLAGAAPGAETWQELVRGLVKR